ncbi:hypothetical protein [Streptomyces pseudovenezuelae]|uniref:hypothetical protein n=1 Tax=Streptomyces pseudovenezuelae TaxID=67350 RepID=UPI002E7FF799|nr:hypothetical protein [Streptomyces pseudovenezuelae]WUA94469.1 hypothetical protein OHO81_44650 [Streptomyces pseudovenezuelae]
MKRTEAIAYHQQEASDLRRSAGTSTDPGSRELRAQANDHDAMADMASVGEYPTDLDD